MQRLALITGGVGGLGFATAIQLATSSVRIVLSDLDDSAAVDAAAKLPGSGHMGRKLDVTDEANVIETFAAIENEVGPISILAHFAGALDGAGPASGILVADLSVQNWRRVFDVNALGTFLCVREMVRWRRKVPVEHGRIITVSSLAGQMGGNKAGAGYAASKAAIIGFTKNVARELATAGITVNALAPGAIDTPMYRDAAGLSASASLPTQSAGVPMGRIGVPMEVGAAAAFLASPEASYITGQIIAVNGGSYM